MCRSSLSVRVIMKMFITSSACGIAFDDDGVFVVRVMAVRAKKGLAHRHE